MKKARIWLNTFCRVTSCAGCELKFLCCCFTSSPRTAERTQRAASTHTPEVIPPTAEPRRNAHRGIHGHGREFNGIGGSGERLRKVCPPGTDNGKS